MLCRYSMVVVYTPGNYTCSLTGGLCGRGQEGGGGGERGEGRGWGYEYSTCKLATLSLTYAKVQCRQKWIELAECKG
jgi:hypothetical protein